MATLQSEPHLLRWRNIGATSAERTTVFCIDFGQVVAGKQSGVTTFDLIINRSLNAIRNGRIFARRIDGFYDQASLNYTEPEPLVDANGRGQEAIDERWVEVRINGDIIWHPIGGEFGNDGTGINFFEIHDIFEGTGAFGPESVRLDFRLNVPPDAKTLDFMQVQVGVVWAGDNPSIPNGKNAYYEDYKSMEAVYDMNLVGATIDVSLDIGGFIFAIHDTSPLANLFTHHAEPKGSPTHVPFLLGISGHFDLDASTDDHFEIIRNPAGFHVPDFTGQAWVNTADAGAGERFILDASDASTQWSFLLDGNKPKIIAGPDSLTSATDISDALWHYIVWVRIAAAFLLIYIDGVLDSSTAIATGGSITPAGKPFIGEKAFDGTGNYTGKVDAIGFWKKAISANSVKLNYRIQRLTHGV